MAAERISDLELGSLSERKRVTVAVEQQQKTTDNEIFTDESDMRRLGKKQEFRVSPDFIVGGNKE